ncbi:MAG: CoA transferase, partial [Thermoplasmata archaeon]|nr:CoA transferase [Thermoplasmata archaeon]
ERTGRGQSVDVAQYEIFFTLLENLALDYFLRGVVRGRHGTAHPRLHPYNVYPCLDGWVVLAAPTHEAWLRVRELVGITDRGSEKPGWSDAHRAEVDGAIESFCLSRSGEELERIGRSSDLALSRVYDMAAIAHDPHYRQREMFLEWVDPVAGRVKGAGIAPKFGQTPGRVWRGAPWLGQDNEAILTAILGFPRERVEALSARGIIGSCPPSAAPAESPPPYFVREGI